MHAITKGNVFHIWSVLCQEGAIKPETNDLSLNNVIEGITIGFEDVNKLQQFTSTAAEKPVLAPAQSELVILWKKLDRSKPAAFDVRVRYMDPARKELQSMEFPLKMEDGTFRHRHRLSIPGIIITTSGEYLFIVEAKGPGEKEDAYIPVAEIPLDINFALNTELENK